MLADLEEYKAVDPFLNSSSDDVLLNTLILTCITTVLWLFDLDWELLTLSRLFCGPGSSRTDWLAPAQTARPLYRSQPPATLRGSGVAGTIPSTARVDVAVLPAA
jgi:hypothetical protein